MPLLLPCFWPGYLAGPGGWALAVSRVADVSSVMRCLVLLILLAHMPCTAGIPFTARTAAPGAHPAGTPNIHAVTQTTTCPVIRTDLVNGRHAGHGLWSAAALAHVHANEHGQLHAVSLYALFCSAAEGCVLWPS
jgi:hypothetical protein